MPTASAPINILLVEDNPADVRLTVEALKEASASNSLHVVSDGAEAMSALRRVNGAGAGTPDLILLDLNLPRKDGREVLQAIKEDERLRHIPVVVFTTSQAEEDIVRAYRLGANAFITKPVEVHQFFAVVQAIERFWLEVVKLLRP